MLKIIKIEYNQIPGYIDSIHGIIKFYLNGELIRFSGESYSAYNLRVIMKDDKVIGIWQPSWDRAYIVDHKGQVICIDRTYANRPIPLKIWIEDNKVYYHVANKHGETRYIRV